MNIDKSVTSCEVSIDHTLTGTSDSCIMDKSSSSSSSLSFNELLLAILNSSGIKLCLKRNKYFLVDVQCTKRKEGKKGEAQAIFIMYDIIIEYFRGKPNQGKMMMKFNPK